MASKGRPHPDHYQTAVRVGVDKDRSREEIKKLQEEETPGVGRGRTPVGHVVHAGQPLGHATTAVCTGCEVEVGLEGGIPVVPCENCGCESFRVVG